MVYQQVKDKSNQDIIFFKFFQHIKFDNNLIQVKKCTLFNIQLIQHV